MCYIGNMFNLCAKVNDLYEQSQRDLALFRDSLNRMEQVRDRNALILLTDRIEVRHDELMSIISVQQRVANFVQSWLTTARPTDDVEVMAISLGSNGTRAAGNVRTFLAEKACWLSAAVAACEELHDERSIAIKRRFFEEQPDFSFFDLPRMLKFGYSKEEDDLIVKVLETFETTIGDEEKFWFVDTADVPEAWRLREQLFLDACDTEKFVQSLGSLDTPLAWQWRYEVLEVDPLEVTDEML